MIVYKVLYFNKFKFYIHVFIRGLCESKTLKYYTFLAQLVQGWKEDAEMEKDFASNDLKLIDKLNDLLDRTKLREHRVGKVKNRLSNGLDNMDKYLGKMAGKKNETSKLKNDESLPQKIEESK